MENQNIQWENWEEQPQENNEQPQSNWGEQPQENNEQPQVNWGEQPPQEQPQQQVNWGEQPQQPNNSPETEITQDLSSVEELTQKEFSYLGGIDLFKIKNELYYLNFNSSLLLEELNPSNLKAIDNDGLFSPTITTNTELSKIISNISKIGNLKGLKLDSCLVKKLSPSESSLNLFKGKPLYNFIVFIQGYHNSGEVILDLSSLGGPSQKLLDTTPNHLSIIPGWIPYSITKNNSENELIALIGSFS